MVVTGYSIGWLAWLSGAVVGVVARLCAPYCAHKLGVAAAISAFLAITLSQGLAGFIIFKKEVADADFKEWAQEDYEAKMNIAKTATDSVRGDNEGEIKKAIILYADWRMEYEVEIEDLDDFVEAVSAGGDGSSGETGWFIAEESRVTDAHIKEFKETIVPELSAFMKGDPSKEEFLQQTEAEYRDSMPTFFVLLGSLMGENLHVANIIFLFLGLGSAYKIAAYEEDPG